MLGKASSEDVHTSVIRKVKVFSPFDTDFQLSLTSRDTLTCVLFSVGCCPNSSDYIAFRFLTGVDTVLNVLRIVLVVI